MPSSIRRWPTIIFVLVGVGFHLTRYLSDGAEQLKDGWVGGHVSDDPTGYDRIAKKDQRLQELLHLYSSVAASNVEHSQQEAGLLTDQENEIEAHSEHEPSTDEEHERHRRNTDDSPLKPVGKKLFKYINLINIF